MTERPKYRNAEDAMTEWFAILLRTARGTKQKPRLYP